MVSLISCVLYVYISNQENVNATTPQKPGIFDPYVISFLKTLLLLQGFWLQPSLAQLIHHPSHTHTQCHVSSFRETIGSTDVIEKELVEMKSVLAKCQSPIVFCHNDLLCANFIYNKEKGDNYQSTVDSGS